MPARAKGLVSSSTRFPASRPSPSTDMTTKSSEELTAPWAPGAEDAAVFEGRAKSSSANNVGQTIEHSIGVIEIFRKGYWFVQDRTGSGDLLASTPPLLLGAGG